MTIVVDANVAVAVLDRAHPFHESAVRRCILDGEIAILTVTKAEALVYPMRDGLYDDASELLRHVGFATVEVDESIARRACELRAMYGARHFPMVDALVVALGIERGCAVVTCDTKWPAVHDAQVEMLRLPKQR